jgi:hypothetical protein
MLWVCQGPLGNPTELPLFLLSPILFLPLFHTQAQAFLYHIAFLTFLCQTDRNITKLVFFFNVLVPFWPAAMLGMSLPALQDPDR